MNERGPPGESPDKVPRSLPEPTAVEPAGIQRAVHKARLEQALFRQRFFPISRGIEKEWLTVSRNLIPRLLRIIDSPCSGGEFSSITGLVEFVGNERLVRLTGRRISKARPWEGEMSRNPRARPRVSTVLLTELRNAWPAGAYTSDRLMWDEILSDFLDEWQRKPCHQLYWGTPSNGELSWPCEAHGGRPTKLQGLSLPSTVRLLCEQLGIPFLEAKHIATLCDERRYREAADELRLFISAKPGPNSIASVVLLQLYQQGPPSLEAAHLMPISNAFKRISGRPSSLFD